ncbi:MAG: putative methyl-accepting chemotaxis protein [Pseudomonadota bacterium]
MTLHRSRLARAPAIWRPGLALFGRLRFRAKALLISLVFLVPILIFGGACLRTLQQQVDGVRQERLGVATLQRLAPVMAALAECAALGWAELAGHDTAAAAAAAARRVDQGLQLLGRQVAADGDPLGLTPDLSTLHTAWQTARSASASHTRHEAAAVALGRVVDRTGEAAGLTLDPEIGSAALAHALGRVLPRLIADLAQVWGYGLYGVTRGALDHPAQYRDVAVWNSRAGVGLADLQAAVQRAVQIRPALATVLDAPALARAERFRQAADPSDLVRAAATADEVLQDGRTALAAVAAVHARGLPALDAVLAERQHRLERERALLLLTAGISLALAGYLFIAFRRVLEDGIRQVTDHLQRMAAGDLTVRPEIDGGDETAQMLAALRDTHDALNAIVREVRQAADGIVGATQEISAGSSDLSARTEHTAADLQRAASSLSGIRAHADEATRQAAEAARLASTNEAQASDGGRVVRAVVDTMGRLQAASQRIGEINGTIDALAFQTNILALNAAVEAARAGEQGRGFAVVAAEVRSLAQRSATAAREIRSLIGQNAELTAHGTGVASEAGDAMGRMVASAGRIRGLLGDISDTAAHQTGQVHGVARTVTDLDTATQRNTALAEETAAACEALRQRGQRLAASVARFRVTGRQDA